MEKQRIKEYSIKDYPSNCDIFVNGEYCFHYDLGERRVYTEKEYEELCLERLISLFGDLFERDDQREGEIRDRIIFLLNMRDFFLNTKEEHETL